MELNDIQKEAVIGWAKEGLGLSEIQKNLQSEFDLSMTYMDVRFLVLELECSIQDKKVAPKPKPAEPAPVQPGGTPEASPDGMGTDDPGVMSTVTVALDRVVKAGSVISGTVVFSDGVHAAWAVDNAGRMVLDPAGDDEYRPSEGDVRAFQEELKRLISQRGY